MKEGDRVRWEANTARARRTIQPGTIQPDSHWDGFYLHFGDEGTVVLCYEAFGIDTADVIFDKESGKAVVCAQERLEVIKKKSTQLELRFDMEEGGST
jgi:hypothetical protein